MRTPLCLAAGLAFVLACTGGSGEGDGRPGSPSSSGNVSEPAEPSASLPLDLEGVTRIRAAQGYCGGAPGRCYGGHSFTIVLDTGSLEKGVCVEGDASVTQDVTTRTLSADEMQTVRDALAGIRTASDPHESVDGMMFGLTLTTSTGERSYSPSATCNPSSFTKVVAGWEAFWNAVSAL